MGLTIQNIIDFNYITVEVQTNGPLHCKLAAILNHFCFQNILWDVRGSINKYHFVRMP